MGRQESRVDWRGWEGAGRRASGWGKGSAIARPGRAPRPGSAPRGGRGSRGGSGTAGGWLAWPGDLTVDGIRSGTPRFRGRILHRLFSSALTQLLLISQIRLRLLSPRLSHRRSGGEQLRISTNSAVLSWPMLVTSPLAKGKAIGQLLALALHYEVRVQQTVMAGTQPRRTFELSRLLLRKQNHQREGQLKQVLPSQDPQGPLFLVCRPLIVLLCLRR